MRTRHQVPALKTFIAGAACVALTAACAQTASPPQPPASPAPPLVLNPAEQSTGASPVAEEELRQQLQGKTFYLRRGYLGDALHFTETGALDGDATETSYTLSLVQIERVRLRKHRLELECVRRSPLSWRARH